MPALLQILEKILSTLNMYNRHLFRLGWRSVTAHTIGKNVGGVYGYVCT